MALLPQVFYTKDLPNEEAINQNNQKSLQDCISEAIAAMASHKLIVQNIVLGKMIRFSTHERNRNDKSGWCIFDYQDNVLYGAFGCWRNLDSISFTSRSYRELSPVQQHEINYKISERKKENERLLLEQHNFVAGKASELMNTPTQHFTHEYINSKQVNIYHNLRNIDNTLFIPLWDYTGKLWNWQKIYLDASTGRFEKRYFKPTEDASGRKQGCFYPIDGRDDTILICEGYSTGATLHETTGQTVICAMDSGNILPVMITDLSPPSFIIDEIIPDYGFGMIHGQSGHGKTFYVMDMAYHIATGMDWHGKKTEGGHVIYLAGEGHHSLKYRLIGLKQKHGQSLSRLHVSQSGCNLNTPEGLELARTAINATIETTGESPKVIFVDTLHRFLEGDENSSKDAKSMIDSCDILKHEFGCTVILVHHTGLNSDDRARGSSSWKGAMDFEYNIKKSGNVLTQYCKKMKDSEEHKPIVFNLKCVDLIGINHKTGKPVTTLLLELAENQEPPKPRDKETENKVKEDTNTLKACWRHYRSVDANRAYVSPKQLKEYAMEQMGKKEDDAKNMLKTASNRFIGRLIEAKIIEKIPHQNDLCFFFLDPATNFALINIKKEENCDNEEGSEEIPF